MDRVRLGDIAKFQNGKAFKPEQWHDEGLPIIRIQNLNDPEKDYNYHSGEIKPRYHVFDGDILISWSASLGVYEWDRGDAYLNQHIFKTYFKRDDVDKDYFKYMLSLKIEQVEEHLRGSTMKHINKGDFEDLKIPLPSLETQKQIATVLDKANLLSQKRQDTIEKLDELTQAVFLEMFGDPVKNSQKIGVLPIKEIGKVITGNTPPKKNPQNYGNEIEWVKTSNIEDDLVYLTEAEEFLSELGKEKGRVVPSGSILVCCIAGSLSSIGKAAIANREVAFNQQINAIVPYENIDTNFLYVELKLAKRIIQDSSTKSMKGMINKSTFQEIELPIPPFEIQKEYGKKFKKIIGLKKSLIQSQNTLADLFNSLLQKAFKGELFENKELELMT